MVKKCVISEISRTPEVAVNRAANLPVAHTSATEISRAAFQINSAKLFTTLSIINDIKFLENLN